MSDAEAAVYEARCVIGQSLTLSMLGRSFVHTGAGRAGTNIRASFPSDSFAILSASSFRPYRKLSLVGPKRGKVNTVIRTTEGCSRN